MPYDKHQLRAINAWTEKHGSLDGFILPPAAKRKRRNNEESRIQRAVIAWWSKECVRLGIPEILLFSTPNGGFRGGDVTGAIMKAEGLRRGAPDLILAVTTPTGKGLFIEVKTETGVVTPEQEEFHRQLSKQGYNVGVARSEDVARRMILGYLNAAKDFA